MLHVIHLSRHLEEILVDCRKEGLENREKREGREGSKIVLILIFAMVC